MLETAEEVKDLAEQECHRSTQTLTQVPVPVPDPDPYVDGDFDRGGPDERVWEKMREMMMMMMGLKRMNWKI